MTKPIEIVLTVDRAGGRGTVIVQDENEREASLPTTWFPRLPAEGDVFHLTLRPDDALRDQRRDEVARLSNALNEATGPDDIETL